MKSPIKYHAIEHVIFTFVVVKGAQTDVSTPLDKSDTAVIKYNKNVIVLHKFLIFQKVPSVLELELNLIQYHSFKHFFTPGIIAAKLLWNLFPEILMLHCFLMQPCSFYPHTINPQAINKTYMKLALSTPQNATLPTQLLLFPTIKQGGQ